MKRWQYRVAGVALAVVASLGMGFAPLGAMYATAGWPTVARAVAGAVAALPWIVLARRAGSLCSRGWRRSS